MEKISIEFPNASSLTDYRRDKIGDRQYSVFVYNTMQPPYWRMLHDKVTCFSEHQLRVGLSRLFETIAGCANEIVTDAIIEGATK